MIFKSNFTYKTAELLYQYSVINIHKPRIGAFFSDNCQINRTINNFYINNKLIIDPNVFDFYNFESFKNKKIVFETRKLKSFREPPLSIFSNQVYSIYTVNISDLNISKEVFIEKRKNIPIVMLMIKPKKRNEKVYVFIRNNFLYFIPENIIKKEV